jgi:CHAT domain-containing protein/tetratricopeptide (TPR) repeat protein
MNPSGRLLAFTPIFALLVATPFARPTHSCTSTQDSLLVAARAQNERGGFSESAALYETAFYGLESAFGVGHPHVAETAIGYSVCLSNLGEYEQAEKILRRCLEETIRIHGEHDGVAGRLMLALADVLDVLGQQVESTRLYRQSAVIAAEAYGPDNAHTALALSGLAHTKRRMGDFPGAIDLYRRCVEIAEKNYGAPHTDLIHYRSRLGMSMFERARDAEAGLVHVDRAISEAVELFGRDSYQVALEERQRGLLLISLQRYDDAREVFARSQDILERDFGPDHPYLSKCLKGLADSCAKLGLYEDAHRHIDRAIALHKDSAGRDQYELAYLYAWKATIELQLERWHDAVETLILSVDTSHRVLDDLYQVSSSREALMYANRPQSGASQLIGAADACPDLSDSTFAEVFARVMVTHGQVLDRLAERHRLLEGAGEQASVEQKRSEYAQATQHVADLVTGGRGDDPVVHSALLEEARARQEEAERELHAALEWSPRSSSPASESGDLSVTRTAAALPPGTALVHLVKFSKWLRPEAAEILWRVSHYGAFVLRATPGGDERPLFVDLGSSGSIDSLIFRYRGAIDGIDPGRRPTTREESEFRSIARELYDRVWAPVMDAGGHPETVFIVPVSWFYLVDFNTLLDSAGGLVIENSRLHYLSSARDLLKSSRDGSHGSGLLAVGNPTYAPPEARAVELKASPALCVDDASLTELPGSEQETQTVAELFRAAAGESATVLLGAGATEQAVKEMITGKRYAHFATHGFFCDEDTRAYRPQAHRLVDPLLHSGLVLSNTEGDGLLTAQELVCLDLHALDWVVLSACGSGLGRLVIGEGTFGMRRAFEIAGAGTVVTALWEIGDAQTRHLMSEIYRRRLSGATTIDAIRLAQLDRMRDQRHLFNRIHPTLWGGIIAEGNWR